MRNISATAALVLLPIAVAVARQAAPLKILVLEGEGAVNIIQQKTAVRPLVEVRDANNLPVSGATVTFTIGSGQPAVFAGGAQTLTVTTGTTGQAAASGLNATGSGAVRIQVQAAHQGRIATTAITQTNFATAAAAAAAGVAVQAGGAAAGTTSAAGAAAGAGAAGGGGLSATTIAIVGAAVGAGAVAATQLTGQQDSNPDVVDTYTGPVRGEVILTSMFSRTDLGPLICTFRRTFTGTLTLNLQLNGTGGATLDLSSTAVRLSGGCNDTITPFSTYLTSDQTPVTGGPSAITFSRTLPDSVTTETYRFTGSLSGNTISGTLSLDVVPSAGANPRYNGSTSTAVTLTGPRR